MTDLLGILGANAGVPMIGNGEMMLSARGAASDSFDGAFVAATGLGIEAPVVTADLAGLMAISAGQTVASASDAALEADGLARDASGDAAPLVVELPVLASLVVPDGPVTARLAALAEWHRMVPLAMPTAPVNGLPVAADAGDIVATPAPVAGSGEQAETGDVRSAMLMQQAETDLLARPLTLPGGLLDDDTGLDYVREVDLAKDFAADVIPDAALFPLAVETLPVRPRLIARVDAPVLEPGRERWSLDVAPVAGVVSASLDAGGLLVIAFDRDKPVMVRAARDVAFGGSAPTANAGSAMDNFVELPVGAAVDVLGDDGPAAPQRAATAVAAAVLTVLGRASFVRGAAEGVAAPVLGAVPAAGSVADRAAAGRDAAALPVVPALTAPARTRFDEGFAGGFAATAQGAAVTAPAGGALPAAARSVDLGQTVLGAMAASDGVFATPLGPVRIVVEGQSDALRVMLTAPEAAVAMLDNGRGALAAALQAQGLRLETLAVRADVGSADLAADAGGRDARSDARDGQPRAGAPDGFGPGADSAGRDNGRAAPVLGAVPAAGSVADRAAAGRDAAALPVVPALTAPARTRFDEGFAGAFAATAQGAVVTAPAGGALPAAARPVDPGQAVLGAMAASDSVFATPLGPVRIVVEGQSDALRVMLTAPEAAVAMLDTGRGALAAALQAQGLRLETLAVRADVGRADVAADAGGRDAGSDARDGQPRAGAADGFGPGADSAGRDNGRAAQARAAMVSALQSSAAGSGAVDENVGRSRRPAERFA